MGTTKYGAHGASHAAPDHRAAVAALGRRIHDLRDARGFSLQEFAHLSGMSAPVMSALERGETASPVTVLFAAADALDLPVTSLFPDAAPVAPRRPAAAAGQSVPAAAAHSLTAEVPADAPSGYRPLEMPALWEPPAGTPEDQPAYAHPAAAAPSPAVAPHPSYTAPAPTYAPRAPEPAPAAMPSAPAPRYAPRAPQSAPGATEGFPVWEEPVYAHTPRATPAPAPAPAQPVYAVPTPEPAAASWPQPAVAVGAGYPPAAPRLVPVGAPAPAPAYAVRPHPASAPAPRTFADLRVGVLADRSFETLPQFAVAAVVEAGHPVSTVASIFRVPSWRLEGWVRNGPPAPAGSKAATRLR